MKNEGCCVAGHRKIDPSKIEYVKSELQREILSAIQDGCTHFLCGMAEGTDCYFASIVAELKGKYAITLEAVIPYRNRLNAKDKEFRRLIKLCDTVTVHSDEYTKSCFINRNCYMVQNVQRLICVYDGRNKGGTLFTMRYAHTLGREIREILI